ncbi:hypothetical protein [Massilia sp. TSP1-1-2]|uniref:hypothetical protein n=1 Tax=unclassified Massilia TaxID=2609279 RepID=UPI003CF3DD70
MAYALETISQADQEKILADAAAFPAKKTWLSAVAHSRVFPKTWAVDRGRDCYLMFMPAMVRTDMMEQPYVAFVDGRMYQINLTSIFSHSMYFDEPSLPSGPSLKLLHREVTAAFAVLGEFGGGPMNARGVPEHEIVPVFVTKGA